MAFIFKLVFPLLLLLLLAIKRIWRKISMAIRIRIGPINFIDLRMNVSVRLGSFLRWSLDIMYM